MRRGRQFAGTAAAALLGAACLAAASAAAQDAGSVSDYRLPPGSSATAPPAAGPVDPDVPVVRPTRAPEEQVGPPRPSPSAAPPEPAPERTSRPAPAPRTPPPATPATTPAPVEAAPLPTDPAPPTASTEPAVPAAAPVEPETAGLPWLAILAGLAALLALAALAWMRTRTRTVPEAERAAPRHAAPQPSAPAALPKVLPQSLPSPLAPASAAPLALSLEASELTRSLVYATLTYRLVLTNTSSRGLGPLRIAGDLAAAHASLSAADQLAPMGGMEPLHELALLAPGETVTLSGSLRLPLAAIRPIRQGEAMLFVPLVRFRITDESGATDITRVFVVGEPGRGRADTVRPLRLDGFPGVIRPLGAREILLDGALAAG